MELDEPVVQRYHLSAIRSRQVNRITHYYHPVEGIGWAGSPEVSLICHTIQSDTTILLMELDELVVQRYHLPAIRSSQVNRITHYYNPVEGIGWAGSPEVSFTCHTFQSDTTILSMELDEPVVQKYHLTAIRSRQVNRITHYYHPVDGIGWAGSPEVSLTCHTIQSG